MGKRRGETTIPTAVLKIGRWVRSRSVREKVMLGTVSAIIFFIFLTLFVKDRSDYYVFGRATHALGLFVLLFKLHGNQTCAGLSLKMQELTAIYLITRLVCIAFLWDFRSLLDVTILCATLWIIYTMRFKLKSSYMKELDDMPLYYVLVPCAVAAVLAHPKGQYGLLLRFLWPFSVCVEAVSVLPQLRLIQNAKMVEPFTSHYVFALGVSRFLQCAYWIIQIIETKGAYLMLVGDGHLWILLALLSEVVQTFILADFCYYYVKSVIAGQQMRLPSMV